MPSLNQSNKTLNIALLGIAVLLFTACGNDTNPNKCNTIPETRGEAIARKSVMQFLRYAGKTHAPITGDGGTLDPAKLERISDSDLVYDRRASAGGNTYQFHLRWSPNAIFTGTVASNCSVTTNWSVQ